MDKLTLGTYNEFNVIRLFIIMQKGIDLKLQRKKALAGMYDINIVNGELELTDTFDTSLQMSVLCEKRADGSEVLTPQNRRGWWGNTISNILGFEIGSKIWIYHQSRLDQNILNKVINAAQEATNWYVENGYLNKVEVEGRMSDESSIMLIFKLYRNPDEVETKFFTLWGNTETFEERSL